MANRKGLRRPSNYTRATVSEKVELLSKEVYEMRRELAEAVQLLVDLKKSLNEDFVDDNDILYSAIVDRN